MPRCFWKKVSAMSLQKQVPSSLFLKPGLVIRILIWVSFISGRACQNVSITCPSDTPENPIAKIFCVVDSTNASCTNGSVQFVFQNTASEILCLTSDSGSCIQEPVGVNNCSCVKSEAGVNTYQLNFPGNETAYEGGNLTCRINCLPVESYASPCTFFRLYTTTGSTSPSTPSDDNKEESSIWCNEVCKIGLGAGIPAAVAVLSAVKCLHRKRREANEDSRSLTANDGNNSCCNVFINC